MYSASYAIRVRYLSGSWIETAYEGYARHLPGLCTSVVGLSVFLECAPDHLATCKLAAGRDLARPTRAPGPSIGWLSSDLRTAMYVASAPRPNTEATRLQSMYNILIIDRSKSLQRFHRP